MLSATARASWQAARRCVTAAAATGARGSSKRALHASTAANATAYKAPLTEVQFLLKDVYNVQDSYAKLPNTGGPNADADMVDMVLQEMARFCEQELSPLNETADQEGCTYVDEHTVKTPAGFKEAYDQYVAGGWQGLNYPEKYGGQGLPYSMQLFASEMTATANWTWTMYPGLSKGAINTIISHGTDALKAKYLPQMVSGEWTGTMCLTEPQCGSDLAQVKTRAIPNGDGTYKITGTKIFISCGEHDLTDNIVHCVLARLPDAPEGTKGISLFSVPKRVVNEDGSLGDLNGANIGRIENKMGCHGSSTCEINFEDAVGELIGTENRGLNHMFTFINTSRLGTAIQGVAAAELSFQGALWYAKERLSMRSLSGTKHPDKPYDPLIVHPDIRRMLLTQKCIAEGGRSMIYECALLNDESMEAEAVGDTATVKAIDDRMGFLTPILKGFLTEKGIEAANMGVQVYGGHGYIKENGQEQIVRDARIAALWEGTTGIQALDLLARKIMLKKLGPITQHCTGLYKQFLPLITGGATMSVRKHAAKLMWLSLKWHANTFRIAARAQRQSYDAIGVASVDYLMYAGYITLGEHWLRMEQAAAKSLASGSGGVGNEEFYKAKIQTAAFFFDHLLPRTKAHADAMFTPVDSVMGMAESDFSFDHARDA